jgi:hypothetical protein
MVTDVVSRRMALTALSSVAGAAGGAMVAGQQAQAATVPAKGHALVVAITDFGAVADSTGQNIGTDNGAAIQNAITHVWQQGGGIVYVPSAPQADQNQPLEARLAYGWQGPLVLPSNVRIIGDGPGGSVLRCLNNHNTPVITVGTFGPANGNSLSSCPKYPIQDIPVQAVQSQVVCRNPSDAGQFVVGDVVGIEGCGATFSKADQFLPNMAARVTGVDRGTGTITLDHAIDDGEGMGYVARGGASPGIRKLGNPQVNGWSDCTGHQWPLFVAMNAGIESLAIDVPKGTGWAVLNLSTYGCQFRHLELNGNYIAGDPVAYTLFEDVYLKYYGGIFEGAYLTHDTVFRDCTFARHPAGTHSVQSVPLIWINQGEGGKRCHFERITVTDRADVAGPNTVQALGLRGGSSVTDSRIVIPKGTIGYAQGGSEIRNSVLLCDASTVCAINLEGASLTGCQIRGGNQHAVIADGTCQIRDNTIGDQSHPPQTLRPADTIQLRKDAQRSVVRGNVTAKYSGQDSLWSNAWGTKLTVNGGTAMLADIPPGGAFDRLLDPYWKLKGDFWITLSGQGNGRLAVIAYDGQGAAVELSAMNFTGATGFQHVEIEIFHHAPGDSIAAWSIRMTGPAKVSAAGSSTAGSTIHSNQITGFGVRISGLGAGDGVELGAGDISLTPVWIY